MSNTCFQSPHEVFAPYRINCSVSVNASSKAFPTESSVHPLHPIIFAKVLLVRVSRSIAATVLSCALSRLSLYSFGVVGSFLVSSNPSHQRTPPTASFLHISILVIRLASDTISASRVYPSFHPPVEVWIVPFASIMTRVVVEVVTVMVHPA